MANTPTPPQTPQVPAPAQEPAPAPTVYAPEAGKVAIRDPDGSVWKIPAEDLPKALTEGARPASEAEYFNAQLGTAPAQVAAGGAGFVRGAGEAFGIPTDAAAVKVAKALGGDDAAHRTARALELLKEAHPDATTLGELGGMAVPMLFGGEGGAAEALGTRVLRSGVRAAGEGARMSVAAQANEDALGNHAFNAENYVSAAFKGGGVGFLLGAGLAGLGGATSDAAKQVRRDIAERFYGGQAAQEARATAAQQALALGQEEAPTAAHMAEQYRTVLSPGFEEQAVVPVVPKTPGAVSPAVEGELASGSPGLSPDLGDEGAVVPTRAPNREARRAQVEEGLLGPEARTETLVPTPRISPEVPGGFVGGEPAPTPFRFVNPDEVSNLPGLGGVEAETAFPPGERPLGDLVEPAGGDLLTARRYGGPVPAEMAAEGGFNVSPTFEARTALGRAPSAVSGLPAIEDIPNVRAQVQAAREARRIAAIEELENRSALDDISKMADRQRFEVANPKMGDIRKIGGTAQEQQLAAERIGATLKRTVNVDALETPQTLSPKVAKALDAQGQEIGTLYQELDKAATRPSLDNILSRYESEVRQPTLGSMYGDREIKAADDAVRRMRQMVGEKKPSFKKLWEVRKDLDAELYDHYQRPKSLPGAALPPGEEQLAALRDLVSEELEIATEKASLELKQPLAQRLRFANQTYRDLRIVKDITARESARAVGNNRFTLSDMLAVAAAMAHPSPLAVAGVAGNFVRKRFGHAIAANVLDRVAQLRSVQDATVRMDQLLNKRTRAFIEGQKPKGLRPIVTVSPKQIAQLREVVTNPQEVRARIEHAVEDIAPHAPKTAAAISTHLARMANYLAMTLPTQQKPPGAIFTQRPPPPLSDTELRRASAILETAADPTIVADRLIQGRLTPAHIEALKMSNPENFTAIRKYLTDHAAELRPKLNVQDQVTLSMLFGTAINPVMDPGTVRALQASFVGGNQAPKAGTSGSFAPSTAKMATGPMKVGQSGTTYWSAFAKPDR